MAAEPPVIDLAEDRSNRHRADLQRAVLRGDEAEVQALRELDESTLYEAYTGRMLQSEIDRVVRLRANNQHQAAQMVDIEWGPVSVSPDEQSADVEVTETWYTEFHRNGDDACLGRVPRHEVPQTAHLRWVSGAWRVESVTYHARSPQMESC
jgi:hypothetical protein